MFSKYFASLFTTKIVSKYEMRSGQRKLDHEEKRYMNYFTIILFSVIALQVATLLIFFGYQKNALITKGAETKAVVFGKVLKQYKGKQYYHIYYDFEIENQRYTFNERNDIFNVGDTIHIRYLPKNPYNHIVIKGQ